MPAPRWLARFNLRVTNNILGPLARRLPGMGFVIHVGRKSRREYRTPVMIFRRGDRLIIALTYGPASQWVLNVLAQGTCDFETQGRILHLVNPRVVHDEQRREMPASVRLALGLLNVSDFLELTIS
jgi:deazaflavin-dependent oxidoreductase (nitroreductase family)